MWVATHRGIGIHKPSFYERQIKLELWGEGGLYNVPILKISVLNYETLGE
jgi:hypothetical protein